MVSNNNITQIGRRIKTLRQERELTIQNVADKSGISKGMLSRIENGRTIPSLPVALNIINALEISLVDFFSSLESSEENDYILIKRADRNEINKEDRSIGFTYLSGINTSTKSESMEVNFLIIDPNSKRKKVTTEAYELKYVIRGSIDYMLDNTTIKLEEGDLFYYNGNIPHVPINSGSTTAELLVIYFFKN